MRHVFLVCVVAILLASSAIAAQVDPGYDLFATLPGSFFVLNFGGLDSHNGPLTVPLTGVPISPGSLGNTDTIVQRLNGAPVTLPGSVPIEIIALELKSTQPVQLYSGDFPAKSFFDVFVDIELPSLTPSTPPPLPVPILPQSNGGLQFPTSSDFPAQSFFDVFVDVQVAPVGGGTPTDLGVQQIDLTDPVFQGGFTPSPLNPYPFDLSFPANGLYPLNLPLAGPGGVLLLDGATPPEPATPWLVAAGLGMLVWRMRRRGFSRG